MGTLKTRLFGEVVVTRGGAFLERKRSATGRTLTPSLYVGEGLDRVPLEGAAVLLDDMRSLEARAREAIRQDFGRGAQGVVAAFVAFHLDELDAAVVRRLFGDAGVESAAAALTRLELVGLAVHAEKTAGFSVVFDFSFGPEHTDELLAVAFRADGQVLGVRHES